MKSPFDDPEETMKERDVDFELVLHGCETRCKFESWKTQRGWINSAIQRQKYIRAVEMLLNLGKEVYNENKNNLSLKLIAELEGVFYGDGGEDYPTKPTLSSLKKEVRADIKEWVGYEIAGYNKDGEFISKIGFQEHELQMRNAMKIVYATNGPFYTLFNKINKIIGNRYKTIITKVKTKINAVNSAFNYQSYKEFIDIIPMEEMSKEEQKYITQDRATERDADWNPQHSKPERSTLPFLTNNPFIASEVFTSMSINVSDLSKRFLHLEPTLGFLRLGLRAIIYKKGNKENKKIKQWFSIKLKDDKKFDGIYDLTSYYHMLNEILHKTDVLEEQIAIQEVKAELVACLRKVSSKLYALVTYALGFKPSSAGGSDFDEMEKPSDI